jgi:hypothetical protein
VVYTREAHALDGSSPRGGDGNPLVEEPLTLDERSSVAKTCVAKLDLAPLTTLIDNMDDSTSDAYASFPDRLYLVGKDGKIAYAGARGPRGFSPDELEDAIRVALELKPLEREE